MTRIVLRAVLRQLLLVAACVLISAWAPVAWAQHGGHGGGGGHFGGGGGHFSGGIRMNAPRGFAPTPSRSMVLRPRTLAPRTFSVP